MYDTAIQIPSGTCIGLPTSQLFTSWKKNKVSFDPIGAYSMDRKILSRQNQNRSNPEKHPKEYRIARIFTSQLLIYSIKKNKT